MEGAGSLVTQVEDGWVRKTQKRSARGRRNSICTQQALQAWCAEHLTAAEGQEHFFSPAVRTSAVPHSQEMQRVNTDELWLMETLPSAQQREQDRFALHFMVATGQTLWDMELYPQPNGKIAVLDFDQCKRVKL